MLEKQDLHFKRVKHLCAFLIIWIKHGRPSFDELKKLFARKGYEAENALSQKLYMLFISEKRQSRRTSAVLNKNKLKLGVLGIYVRTIYA